MPYLLRPDVSARLRELKAFAAFDFREALKPPNRGLRLPGGGWAETGGTMTLSGSGDGAGAANGSGGMTFGTNRSFDGFSPASSPCWFAAVLKHGAYVNQGSGQNTWFNYGSIGSLNGFTGWVDSGNAVVVRLGDTALTGPTLVAGRTYRLAWGRNAAGACWLWVNGKLTASGSGATLPDSDLSRILRVLTDETANRYYKGSINCLAFGSDDPSSFGMALSANPWQLFRPAVPRTYFFPAGGGGSTYDVSLSESGSATDSLSSAATLAASIAEAASAADALSSAATLLASVAEAASATETVNWSVPGFDVTISESASATDSVSSQAQLVAAITETAAALDSLSSLAVLGAAIAEAVSATDFVSAGAATYSVDVAETASATDLVSSIATLLAALAETGSATDSVSIGAATYAVDFAEAASAVDAITVQLQRFAAIAEAANATDTLSALGQFGAQVAEAAAALDVVSALGILAVTITEAGNATDLVSAPTGFGETPAGRTIHVKRGDRTITVRMAGRTINVH